MSSEPPALNKFKKKIAWESIDQKRILAFLQFCVAEDLGFANEAEHRRDLTSDVCSIKGEGSANLVAREKLIYLKKKLSKYLRRCFDCQFGGFCDHWVAYFVIGSTTTAATARWGFQNSTFVITISYFKINFL